MAKPEWGNKRICQSCGAPFYDLQRDPIVCPKCEAVFDLESVLKSRRPRGKDAEPAEKAKPRDAKDAPEAPKAPAAEEVDKPEHPPKADGDSSDVDGDGDTPEKEDNVLADDGGEETVLEDAGDLGNDEDVVNVIDVTEKEEDT